MHMQGAADIDPIVLMPTLMLITEHSVARPALSRPGAPMDFIFMLTRNDRTVEDAESLVDQVSEL